VERAVARGDLLMATAIVKAAVRGPQDTSPVSEESTTPDLVKLTRQLFEAVSRGDLEPLASLWAPDAVLDASDAGLGTFEGVEAIGQFFEDWHGSFEDYRFEEEEILDLGHGVVLSIVRESARLAGGEGRVEQRALQVWIWANGKLEWLKAYANPDEARAAAERLARERGG